MKPWERAQAQPLPSSLPLTPSGIVGAQAAAATQAALPITPSVGDKLVSAGVYTANTALVTAAPMFTGDSGVGGIEISLLGDGLLVIVQALQVHDWYDRNKWGVWTILGLAAIICIGLWHDDLRRAVLNMFGSAYKAFTSFGALSKLGVLSGQTEPAGNSPG